MSHVRVLSLVAPSALGLAVLVPGTGSSEEGDTDVVKAGPELVIVGQPSLDAPVDASAPVPGEPIDIRNHPHQLAIGDSSAS